MRTVREQAVEASQSDGSGPKVSVIVPAYNAAKTIPGLVDAFRAQTAGSDAFELLIVDDCSSDETARIVDESGVAKVVRSRSRGRSARARNLGLQVASAPVVAFTDADCEPAPDWIEKGLAAIGEADIDILVGHVAMPLGERPTRAALIDGSRNLNQEQYAGEGHGATANLWVRRSMLETVGLFNPNLISGADTELCHRAVAAGARVGYRAEVVVSHAPRRKARALARKCFRLGFGAAQHRRHADHPALRNRPRYWLHPGSYLFRWNIKGIERLEHAGYRFRRLDIFMLGMVQHLCVRLPYAGGNLVGTLSGWLARGRPDPVPVLDGAPEPIPR